MFHRKTSFCLLVSGLFWALAFGATSQAADLDGGYAPAPLPEQKVEFGSGWYVRGDIGVTDNYEINAAAYSGFVNVLQVNRSNVKGYDLSLGGGYSFLNGIRTDIVADFHQPSASEQLGQPCFYNAATGSYGSLPVSNGCAVTGKFAGYDALINAYYDFGTWYRVTPYVGAGVGVAFGSASSTDIGDPATSIAKDKYHNLAFALMGGVSIDVFDHTKLDLGYRYLDNGRVASTHIYFHEIRAGLRYMIDN